MSSLWLRGLPSGRAPARSVSAALPSGPPPSGIYWVSISLLSALCSPLSPLCSLLSPLASLLSALWPLASRLSALACLFSPLASRLSPLASRLPPPASHLGSCIRWQRAGGVITLTAWRHQGCHQGRRLGGRRREGHQQVIYGIATAHSCNLPLGRIPSKLS